MIGPELSEAIYPYFNFIVMFFTILFFYCCVKATIGGSSETKRTTSAGKPKSKSPERKSEKKRDW